MADRDDLEFTYSLIDRDLPAQPGRARGLQRSQVRRRLLTQPRGGAAAQARVRGRADRDRAGAARARPRLRMGSAARLHPAQRRHRRRRDAVLRAGGGLPAPRPRRPHPRRARSSRASASAHSTQSQASAPSSTSARPRRSAPGARTRSTETCSPAIASVLPAGGRLYLQTMVFGRNMIPLERGRHKRAARLRRVVPGPHGPPVPGVVTSLRPGAGGPLRQPALPARVERQRPARLHRDHPPVAQAVRGAERPQAAVEATAAASLADERDFRLAFTSGVSANSVCFERELLDHYRLVFEKHR